MQGQLDCGASAAQSVDEEETAPQFPFWQCAGSAAKQRLRGKGSPPRQRPPHHCQLQYVRSRRRKRSSQMGNTRRKSTSEESGPMDTTSPDGARGNQKQLVRKEMMDLFEKTTTDFHLMDEGITQAWHVCSWPRRWKKPSLTTTVSRDTLCNTTMTMMMTLSFGASCSADWSDGAVAHEALFKEQGTPTCLVSCAFGRLK